MNNTSCVQALEVFSSQIYQTAQPLVFIVDVCAIVANLVLSLSFARVRSYHVNVRILIPSRAMACVVASMGHLFRILNTWLSNGTSNCLGLLATFSDCTINQVVVIGYIAIVLGGVILAIDRIMATYLHATYENMKWYFGAGAAIIGWIVAIVVEINGKGKPYVFASSYFPFCAPLSDRTNYVNAATTSAELVLALLTTYAFFKLSVVSKRKVADFVEHQQHLTLSSRLQLKHNIELTRTLLPSEVVHGVVWVVDLAVYLITVWVIDPNAIVTKFIYWPYVNLWVASYMLVQPVLMIHENEKVRLLLKEDARAILRYLGFMSPSPSDTETVVVGIRDDVAAVGDDRSDGLHGLAICEADARNQRTHFDFLLSSWRAAHSMRHS